MQRHGTPRRRSRMQGKGGDMLYERARDLAKQQLASERETVPYRRVEDQQKAMRQRNDQALNQERKKSEAQIIDQQMTSERRQQLVSRVAKQRGTRGPQANMRQGTSPSTGQGGVMRQVRNAKGNPPRALQSSYYGSRATGGAFMNPFPSVRAESRIHGGGERITEDDRRWNPRTMGNHRGKIRHRRK